MLKSASRPRMKPSAVTVLTTMSMAATSMMVTPSIATNAMFSAMPMQKALQDRRHALDALGHAGRQRRQQQLGRVEGLAVARHVGVQRDDGVLAARFAGVGVQPHRHHVELHPGAGGIGHRLSH